MPFGRTCSQGGPGLARPSTKKPVDARNKSGHDDSRRFILLGLFFNASQRSAAAAAEDAPQRDIGGGRVRRAPEAGEIRIAAQFLVGKGELHLQLRAAGGLRE